MQCKPDRYVSYQNIDCAGNSKRMLRRHIDGPEKTNAFWEKFKQKLAQVGQPQQNHDRSLTARSDHRFA